MGVQGFAPGQPPDRGLVHRARPQAVEQGDLADQRRLDRGLDDPSGPLAIAGQAEGRGLALEGAHHGHVARRLGGEGAELTARQIDDEIRRDHPPAGVSADARGLGVQIGGEGRQAGEERLGAVAILDPVLGVEKVRHGEIGARHLVDEIGAHPPPADGRTIVEARAGRRCRGAEGGDGVVDAARLGEAPLVEIPQDPVALDRLGPIRAPGSIADVAEPRRQPRPGAPVQSQVGGGLRRGLDVLVKPPHQQGVEGGVAPPDRARCSKSGRPRAAGGRKPCAGDGGHQQATAIDHGELSGGGRSAIGPCRSALGKRDHPVCVAIQSDMILSSTVSGTPPAFIPASWKARMSNRSPSAAWARARSSTHLLWPTL